MSINPLSGLSNPSGIGLSTGIYNSLWGNWPALIANVRAYNPHVAELNAMDAHELPKLGSYMHSHPKMLGEEYSVHTPSKNLGPTGLLAVSGDLLSISTLTPRLIVHPDTIGDGILLLRDLGSKIALENMDSRKTSGRDVASLNSLFAILPEARFCLDVAHAWSIDPSLRLAYDLLEAFGDRLVQVHLSGINNQGHHQPLEAIQLKAYLPVLERCHQVPWILESSLA